MSRPAPVGHRPARAASSSRSSPQNNSPRRLDLQPLGDARTSVDLPGHVDLIVLAVRPDPPGAPEPAPEPEPSLLRERPVEDQDAAAHPVVDVRLLADAVDVDLVGLA